MVDVTSVGGQVPGGGVGVAVFVVALVPDEAAFDIGPVAEPGVAAGAFPGVPHVVSDGGFGDAGCGELGAGYALCRRAMTTMLSVLVSPCS